MPSRVGAEDGVDIGLDVSHELDAVVVQLLSAAVLLATPFVAFIASVYASPLVVVRSTMEVAGWTRRAVQVMFGAPVEALHSPDFVTTATCSLHCGVVQYRRASVSSINNLPVARRPENSHWWAPRTRAWHSRKPQYSCHH